MNKILGLSLIITSVFAWVFSESLAKIYCGNRYMQAVDGIIGDASCGFNTDMYLIVFLLITLPLGIVLLFTSK